MKRILIFTFLFPPLALLVYVAPDVISMRDFPARILLGMLPFAYGIALVPAWLSAAVNWLLSSKPLRILGTAIAAAVFAELAALYFGHVFRDFASVLVIGLVGAIPAAVCSWLSERTT